MDGFRSQHELQFKVFHLEEDAADKEPVRAPDWNQALGLEKRSV